MSQFIFKNIFYIFLDSLFISCSETVKEGQMGKLLIKINDFISGLSVLLTEHRLNKR